MAGPRFFHVMMGLNVLLASSLTTKIQVCQNKDCYRNFGSKASSFFYNLPQVLQDLTPSVVVESTGCLSKCDKGPNVQVASSSVILHGIKDHIQAAAALETLGIIISAQNMAAIAVLEKANYAGSVLFVAKKDVKGAASVSYFSKKWRTLWIYYILTLCVSLAITAAEKETAFNSVIRTMEPSGGSSVLARALVMRAGLYYESRRLQDTIVDAKEALTMSTTIQVSRRAWRLLADAYTSMGELHEALRCLQDWMNKDPAFRTKIGLEMERLRGRMDD